MRIRPLNELVLYRYRYIIGYALLIILTITLLILNIDTLPPGVSDSEKASAITSSNIKFDFDLKTIGEDTLNFLKNTNTINMPYHLLQKASLHFFGISPLGIRLPSLLIAGASAIILFVSFRRILLPSAAGVTSVIAVTSAWFLSISHVGSANIMIIFWTALIFLSATFVSQESKNKHLWKLIAIGSTALALYTPYTIYLLIAIFISAITQPHLRYIIRKLDKVALTLGAFATAIILIPLAFNIWQSPSIISQLLGIQNIPGPIEFVRQFIEATANLVNPFGVAFEKSPLPLISIPTTIFMIIGITQLLKDWHSVRSHVLLIWTAILITLMGLDSSHNLAPLFIPVVLLCAIGMQAIFKYWYTIFPRNPYARIFGLLPLILLILATIQFNYQRYFLATPFAASTPSLYNQDPFILNKSLSSKLNRDKKILLIVEPQDKEFYNIAKKTVKDLTVISMSEFKSTNNATRIVIAQSQMSLMDQSQRKMLPINNKTFLINDRKEDSLRFRIYSTP